MEENKIEVSIIVLTYNHEEYIRQALDSILMQKVNFSYEILVGEDCSPDNTREILEEYEKAYQKKFVMIYHDVNIGGRKNMLDLYSRARGNYIAQLEGDDFWTSKDKLQKQVDFLQKHKNYIASAHKTKIVDENGMLNAEKQYPECNKTLYTLRDYQYGILPGHSATLVMRNFYRDKLFDVRILSELSDSMPADRVIMYLLASHGNIYCYQDIMSAYRYVTHTGTSFSARQRKSRIDNVVKRIDYYKQIIEYSYEFIDNKDAIVTIESIYMWQSVLGFIRKNNEINYKYLKNSLFNLINKKEALAYVFIRILTLPMRLIDRKNGMIGR